jgi:hypothetical protein
MNGTATLDSSPANRAEYRAMQLVPVAPDK